MGLFMSIHGSRRSKNLLEVARLFIVAPREGRSFKVFDALKTCSLWVRECIGLVVRTGYPLLPFSLQGS